MNKKSELDCFLYYMWNVWSKDVCFGGMFPSYLQHHIWCKWVNYCEEHGAIGAPARLYAELDDTNRRRLVDAAVAHYNK